MTFHESSPNIEAEATLLIRAEDAEAVAGRIAAMTLIAGFALVPREQQDIFDVYLDTANGSLQSQTVALRVRRVNGNRLVTLKGPARAMEWGGVERLEIEMPWSEGALERISGALRERGVTLADGDMRFDAVDALATLASAGLHPIQVRETARTVRDVVEGDTVLAELAVDATVYHIGDRRVRHHEVEVEAKAEGAGEAIGAVIDGLVTEFGAVLRPWAHGKLQTGKAIEMLQADGALEGFLSEDNRLAPGAYDAIDALLSRNAQ